jgi:hypothetical protein
MVRALLIALAITSAACIRLKPGDDLADAAVAESGPRCTGCGAAFIDYPAVISQDGLELAIDDASHAWARAPGGAWQDATAAPVGLVGGMVLAAARMTHDAFAPGVDHHVYLLADDANLPWQWLDFGAPPTACDAPRGNPSTSVAGSIPSFLMLCTNGSLFQLTGDRGRWNWIDRGQPPSVGFASDPVHVNTGTDIEGVIVGADHAAYLFHASASAPGPWTFQSAGPPDVGVTVVGNPALAVDASNAFLEAIMTGSDGQLWVLGEGVNGLPFWIPTDSGPGCTIAYPEVHYSIGFDANTGARFAVAACSDHRTIARFNFMMPPSMSWSTHVDAHDATFTGHPFAFFDAGGFGFLVRTSDGHILRFQGTSLDGAWQETDEGVPH